MNKSANLLIVDDEPSIVRLLTKLLQDSSYTVYSAMAGVDALKILDEHEIDIMVTDIRMPGMDGIELMSRAMDNYPDLQCIVLTAHSEIEVAVKAMKQGALNYLHKPINFDQLEVTIEKALEARRLIKEVKKKAIAPEKSDFEMIPENEILLKQRVSAGLKNPEAFADSVTQNVKMMSIFHYVEVIASTILHVMITGETGVGKDLIVKAIHRLTDRAGKFVSINVAGLDDNIFADTLFGHVKGAYTGAETVREGQVRKADGGTLFLDEIGDLSISSQVKLLRLVQEREYMPLGSDTVVHTDARIIVATNRDLTALKEKGVFREDLFFRLSSHQVHVPPLRERLDDLPVLVEHFIDEASRRLNRKPPRVPKEIFNLLGTYHFPGNIRELRSFVFDAVSKHKSGILSLETFRESIRCNTGGSFSDHRQQGEIIFGNRLPTMKDIRSLLVREAMKRADNNKTVAARLLGIKRQSLSYYLNPKKAD
ncbi:MAG: sigma-54-dependent Fis family transcriptional regulator [Proteobacteria bacterium]|nr:sigma-54-dependent Fis family transcriptional regulator [Pseudomonadota bacterium]